MQALLILLISLVTLAILAGRYGVDSRDGLDWSPPDRARSRGRLSRALTASDTRSPRLTRPGAGSSVLTPIRKLS
jgi:hypothetical protein